jgi:hypothetical protein
MAQETIETSIDKQRMRQQPNHTKEKTFGSHSEKRVLQKKALQQQLLPQQHASKARKYQLIAIGIFHVSVDLSIFLVLLYCISKFVEELRRNKFLWDISLVVDNLNLNKIKGSQEAKANSLLLKCSK